ncbi:hypothetical protein AADG42_09965 [Ammonicoccus fulvus]|uniref:Uncharacterized protein n=1 Tax=Ammonicoccus fulvus TaxID=3138240 RepID=A0ABZ3FPJ6_9ACTN
MKTNPASWPRGRLIAVIAAGFVLLLLVGVGVYGLITGPPTAKRSFSRSGSDRHRPG